MPSLSSIPLVAVAAGLALGALRSPALAQIPELYPIACRGPLSMGVHLEIGDTTHYHASFEMDRIMILFAAAPVAAGAHADRLPPGTCAWVDRPLNSSEPRELWIDLSNDYSVERGSGEAPLPLEQMMFACVSNPSCVLVVHAGAVPAGQIRTAGVNAGGQATAPPPVLYRQINPYGDQQDVLFLRLDAPAKPDLTALPSGRAEVRVNAAPGDVQKH
jgi:hypothetical protein